MRFGSSSRAPKRLPVPLTEAERDALLEAARTSVPRGVANGGQRDAAIVAIGVYAGLRISELHQLDVDDVDLEDLTVRVRHGKGDKERIVPLHRKAAAACTAYLVQRTDDEPALFISRLGRRLSIRAMRDVVYRLAGDAELRKHVRPHTLRHTFATLFLDANPEDIRVLQVLLGHASIATTEIYTHVSQTRRRRGVDRMD